MSKNLTPRLRKVAPAMEAAIDEVRIVVAGLERVRDELGIVLDRLLTYAEAGAPIVPALGQLCDVFDRSCALYENTITAHGRLTRRWVMIDPKGPEKLRTRRRELRDAFVRLAATIITGSDAACVTPQQVDKWIAENNPGEKPPDLATIRAALTRIGRLRVNTPGRPRKVKKQ